MKAIAFDRQHAPAPPGLTPDSRQLGSVLVRMVHADARSRRLVPGKEVGADRPLLCCFVRSGEVSVSPTSQPHIHHTARVGEGLVIDRGDDVVMTTSDGAVLLTAIVPLSTVTSFGAQLQRGQHLFSRESEILPAIVDFFTSLVSRPPVSGAVAAYAVAQLAEEMIGALFLESAGADRSEIRAEEPLFRRAVALIAARRGDSGLTPSSLASDLSVSRRHLERAFAAHGVTPASEIRRLRIEHALRLLSDPTFDVLPIPEVAAFAGFSTVDDLRRAFRLTGLPSPMQVRRQHASAAGPSVFDRSGDRGLSDRIRGSRDPEPDIGAQGRPFEQTA